MKNKILIGSLVFAGSATLLSLIAILTPHVNPHDVDATINNFANTGRLYACAGVLGLFSISSFFVGLAFPVSYDNK